MIDDQTIWSFLIPLVISRESVLVPRVRPAQDALRVTDAYVPTLFRKEVVPKVSPDLQPIRRGMIEQARDCRLVPPWNIDTLPQWPADHERCDAAVSTNNPRFLCGHGGSLSQEERLRR
jgi:hypothetical protein